jgi:hypothetical protein
MFNLIPHTINGEIYDFSKITTLLMYTLIGRMWPISTYKFIDETDILSDNNWIKLEKNNYVNKKNGLFIPNNESKGIVSRAIMYMSYTHGYNYENIINYKNLIKWCITFPPTKEEHNHNNIAYECQKRRNHFIDLYNKENYYYLINNTFK